MLYAASTSTAIIVEHDDGNIEANNNANNDDDNNSNIHASVGHFKPIVSNRFLSDFQNIFFILLKLAM
jgi:hypothetical protein